MHGTTTFFTPIRANLTCLELAAPTERLAYALVGLLLLGALVPIGPIVESGDRGVVSSVCTVGDRWTVSDCATGPRLASAAAINTARLTFP